MKNNTVVNTSEQVIAAILFIFFIGIACGWNHSLEENILSTVNLLGIIFFIIFLICIISLVYGLHKRKYTRIKRLIFSFAPNLTLRRIASIFMIVFMIIATIFYKNDMETNLILSLRIAGVIWVTSIFSEIFITQRRRKRYEDIMKQRRKEPKEEGKQIESSIMS